MGNRTWGQQCCGETPDTLSKSIRAGSYKGGHLGISGASAEITALGVTDAHLPQGDRIAAKPNPRPSHPIFEGQGREAAEELCP